MNARSFALLVVCPAVCLACPTVAHAQGITGSATADADDPTLRSVPAQRRAGLVFGAAGGVGFAGASGYPNSERLKNDPDYYSESPLLVGWSTSYFLMGALTDYLSFGPTLNIATFDTEKWKSTGWALGFRGELFPLLKVVPALGDLALYGQLGFGTTELRAKGPYPSAEGSQSFASIGLHHEWRLGRLLGGHGAAGPYVEYSAIRSPSAERHWMTIGLRLAFYGSKVEADAVKRSDARARAKTTDGGASVSD